MNNIKDLIKKVKAAACLASIYFSITGYQNNTKNSIKTIHPHL